MEQRMVIRYSTAFKQQVVNDLEWADIIFVMEESHRHKLSEKYRAFVRGKRIICLNIPDQYGFMDPALIQLLHASVPRHLRG